MQICNFDGSGLGQLRCCRCIWCCSFSCDRALATWSWGADACFFELGRPALGVLDVAVAAAAAAAAAVVAAVAAVAAAGRAVPDAGTQLLAVALVVADSELHSCWQRMCWVLKLRDSGRRRGV